MLGGASVGIGVGADTSAKRCAASDASRVARLNLRAWVAAWGLTLMLHLPSKFAR